MAKGKVKKQIQAEFTRLAPSSSDVKADVSPGWFAIPHRWIDDMLERRKSHARWFKISCENRSVFRILQFSANLSGTPTTGIGQIVIDWPAWIILSGYREDMPTSLHIKISPAKWWHLPWLAVAHPDPSNKLAGQIALVSFSISIISLIQAILF